MLQYSGEAARCTGLLQGMRSSTLLLLAFALTTSMLCTVGLCDEPVAQLNLTLTSPTTVWTRAPAVETDTPNAPNLVVSQTVGVIVEYRMNESSYDDVYLRGLNISTGNVLWTKGQGDVCSAIQFIDTFGDDVHFIMGCVDHFQILSMASGAATLRVDLPSNVTLTPLSAPITSQSYSLFTVVSPKRYVILSVVSAPEGVGGPMTYGSLLFNVATAALTTSTLIEPCPENVALGNVLTAPGEPGYGQVCVSAHVSYVSYNTSAPVWRNVNSNATGMVAATVAGGASLANIAIGYTNPVTSISYAAVFDVRNSHGMPLWTTETPEKIYALASTGETVFAVSNSYVVGFDGTSGTLLWNQTGFQGLQSVVLVDPMLSASAFFLDDIYIYQLDAQTGDTMSTFDASFDTTSPAWAIAVPLRRYLAPLDSNEVVLSEPEWYLAVGASEGIVLWNCSGASCEGATQIEGGISSPLLLVQLYSATTANEQALVAQTSTGISVFSLTVGWRVEEAYYAGTQDGVVFLTSSNVDDNGFAGALDRNGRTLWTTAAPFTGFSDQPTPFMSNVVFTTIDEATITAINTYNGSILRTLRLSSDCFSNGTQPLPSNVGGVVVPDGTHSNAYFVAALPCLFRIHNDLTLHTILLPAIASTAPVIDDDNGLAYLSTGNQIYTVSIPLGLTWRLLFTTDFAVTGVYPSSAWSAPANQRQGRNTLIYVTTTYSLHAIDVVDRANTLVWTLPAPSVSSLVFYNNSLYFFAPSMGVCRCSLDVTLSPANRVVWCAGAALAANLDNTIPQISVLPNGVLVALLGTSVLAVDATSGRPRWTISGVIALSTVSYDTCPSMVFDPDHYILFASCSYTGIVAVDALHSGHVLYTLGSINNNDGSAVLSYFGSVLFAASTGSSGVAGYPVPPMFSNRSPPPPQATSEPMVETLPPGFVPLPQPEPTAGPYPAPQAAVSVQQVFSKASIVDGDAIESGSGLRGGPLFPGIVFLTPISVGDDYNTAYVQAYNTTSGTFLWSTVADDFLDLDEGEGCTYSTLCGATAETSVFVFLCSADIYAFDASTGANLWNTTTSETTTLAAWTPAPGDGGCVVIGTYGNVVRTYDGTTGAQLAEVPLTARLADDDSLVAKMFYPMGKNIAFLVVSGPGLQVIQLGPHRNNATTTFDVAPGNGPSTPDQFCAPGGMMVAGAPADPSASDAEFVDTDAAYFACMHGVMAHYVAVFRVDLLLSHVAVVRNISLGASSSIYALQVDGPSAAPQVYVLLDALVYRIDAASGAIAWIAAGSYTGSLGLSNELVLVAASPPASNYEITPIVAYNKTSGAYMWNVSTTVYQTSALRVITYDVSPGYVLIGVEGVYAVQYTATSSAVAWATQTENSGWVRSIDAAPSKAFSFGVDGPTDLGTVLEVVIAILDSTGTYVHVALAPSADALSSMVTVDASSAAAYLVPPDANGNPFQLLVASEDDNIVSALSHGWTALVENVFSVAEVSIADVAGGPAVPLAVVFATNFVAVFHLQSGQALGTYFFTDACLGTTGSSGDAAITEVDGSLYFTDKSCVYRLNVAQRSMTATLLSAEGSVDYGAATSAMTSDNTTLLITSTYGAIYSIAIPSLAINWINDAMQFIALEGITGLLLPSYAPSVPKASQQLLLYSVNGLASLSVGTGQVAWVYLTESTVTASLTDDGHALLVDAYSISKINISTAVAAPLDRVLWTVPFGSTIDNTDTLFCMNLIPQSDVVVLLPSTLVAIEVSTGAVLWNVSAAYTSQYDCLMIKPVADPRAAMPAAPALLMVVSEYESIALVNARNGATEYTYDLSPSQATVAVSNGWAAIDTYSTVRVLPLLFPSASAAPPLPPAVTAAPAVIPPSYVYPPPDLNASSTTVAMDSVPIPLSLWVSTPTLPSNREYASLEASFVLASEIQGQDVLIQAYSYYYYVSSVGAYVYVSQMRILHALSGAQLQPVVVWPPCELKWFVALSSKVALAHCPSSTNSAVSLRFIDTTSPSLTTLATSTALTQGLGHTPSVVQLPDFGIACVHTSKDAPFVCFGANPSNRTAFGKVVYQYACPDKLVGVPTYDAMHQLLLLGCHMKSATASDPPTANAVVAINAETGGVTWNASFGVAEVAMVAYSGNFGVVMLTGQLPNVTAGNFTIQAFSLATGATTTPMFDAIPDQDPSQVSGLYVVERSITPAVDLGVIFVTATKTVGYSTRKAQIIWDVYTGDSQNAYSPPLVASTMGVDPVSKSLALYVVSATSATSLFAIDALASFKNEMFVLQFPFDSEYAPQIHFVTHGLSTGLVLNLVYKVYYIDLVARSAIFAVPTGYNTELSANFYLRAAPASGAYELVMDYSGASGNVYQFLVNTTNATTALVNSIASVTLQLRNGGLGAEYVVGTDPVGSTFLFDAYGKLLWGTATTFNSASARYVDLSPQLVETSAEGGRPVLVAQFAPRTFYVYDASNGTILFAGYLPLCNGKGSDSVDYNGGNVVGSVTDVAHDLMYLSVMNPCLYTLNLVTGAVQQTVVPQAIPLLQPMTMTASCVVVMDAYGGVMCFPLGASLAAAPTWTYRLGYTSAVGMVEITAFGSLLLVNNGDELVCLTEAAGQLVWRQALGPRLTFTTYNYSTVVARTWRGVYVMDVDPSLEASQRVQLFVSTVQLFGKEYMGPSYNEGEGFRPVVTANGNVLVAYGSTVFGLKMRTGSVAFRFTTVGTLSAITYCRDDAPLNKAFFVTANSLRMHSVVDGTQVASMDIDADEGTTTIVLLPSVQRIAFQTYSSGIAQVQAIPDFVSNMVPPFTPVAVGPAAQFTLPPNYVPQGEPTPMPTLAPGVTLPVLSCVLNIEALYGDLVTCVNGAVAHIYANRSVDAILCMAAAARLSPCVDAWLANVIPDCPGAAIYLNNVLTSLNASSTFDFCGSPGRCSDGVKGAAAVCTVMNAALQPSGGATFAPQLHLPQPADKLPDFTAPSNTITFPPTTKPVTTMAPSTTTTTAAPGPTTTMAPGATTTPVPLPPTTTTAAPGHTTTMAPGATTTPAPTTSPAPTTTTTMTPATPTTTVAPSQQYIFTCALPFGHSEPADNFATLVGLQIGLAGPAPIALSQVTQPPSVRHAAHVGLNGPTFTFVFTGDSAAPYSQLLFQDVAHNAAAVAQSLGLSSIAGAPYTPQQGGAPPGGISGGAVAGIVITLLVVAAAGGFVAFRHWRRGGGFGRRRQATALRGAMIQEEDGYGGTTNASGSANVLSRREMGDVSPPEKASTSAAPIYSAM